MCSDMVSKAPFLVVALSSTKKLFTESSLLLLVVSNEVHLGKTVACAIFMSCILLLLF